MHRNLLLLSIVGALVAAPLGSAIGVPPPSFPPSTPVSFTPIANGWLPPSGLWRRGLMLIARSPAQTRSAKWPHFNLGSRGESTSAGYNVLLVVDPNAPGMIDIKSIAQFATTKLLVTINAPIPPPIIGPPPVGPGPHGPAFALVELPKFPVTALYGTDVR
jgi:hypothetical protein